MVDNKKSINTDNNVDYNLVDVFYLDYILYKIVESYKYNILDKIKNKSNQVQDTTHEDIMIDKLICKSLISKLQVKYDKELLLKIVYVRILQLLIKYQEDDKLCLYKINLYLKTVKDKYEYIDVKIFSNKKISDVIIWLDEMYEKFNVPYLYKMCIDIVKDE